MLARIIGFIFVVLFVWAAMMYFLMKGHLKNPYKVDPNTVSLSFNGSPNPPYTQEILEILRKKNINAVFFISAENAEKNPQLVSEIYKQGNAVACLGLKNQATFDLMADDLKKCIKIIEKSIGKAPICYRPVSKEISAQFQDYLKSKNLVIIDGAIDLTNAQNLTVNDVVSSTLSLIGPQQMITFPDDFNAQGNSTSVVGALPILIAKINKMGLGFSRICYP